jgi:uncharacterized protein (TIGR00251 family)
MKLQKAPQGLILVVNVKPNSKQFQIKVEDEELVVLCKETPVKGKVNRELIKELSKLFKRRVEIVSGFSSRQKRVLVRDIEENQVLQVLDAAML